MRPPLVLIPGIQGRWEYVRPAVEALTADFEVIAFPLCGEPGSLDRDVGDLDSHAALVARELDRRRVSEAVVCGVSFGGLVALRFAATYPGQVRALVLASAPGPGWELSGRRRLYARFPHLFAAAFFAESVVRLRPEIAAALSGRARRRFVAWQLRTLVAAPLSVRRMAARAKLMTTRDVAADCRRIAAPTLIVTGEPRFDRVVRVETTRAIGGLVPDARTVVLERTGHLGSITRPHEFARVVHDFVFEARDGRQETASGCDHEDTKTRNRANGRSS